MSVMYWLKTRFTRQGKALAIYRRGMKKANARDRDGAIIDYTTIIEMPGVAPGLLAMALFNRGLVYTAIGEDSRGTGDLQEVLDMPNAPSRVKELTRQKLIRMQARQR